MHLNKTLGSASGDRPLAKTRDRFDFEAASCPTLIDQTHAIGGQLSPVARR